MKTTECRPGNYICDRDLRVIKKLETRSSYKADGTVQRTFGAWNTADNFYTFSPNQKVKLTEEDFKNQTIKQLVEKGIIRRVL